MSQNCNVQSDSRLVESPVFILSSLRAGSTLLRVILNSHSMIRSPHEIHLQTLEIRFTKFYTQLAMEKLGLDKSELEYLLWDRLLYRELVRSGKQIVVEKTPDNIFAWRRLQECWPNARYIFLLRHPGSVLTSLREASRELRLMDATRKLKKAENLNGQLLRRRQTAAADVQQSPGPARRIDDPEEKQMTKLVLTHIHAVDEAMRALPGLTVRYENLVEQPEEVATRVCSFLGVPWEPQMLDYGKHDHGSFEAYIGDFTEKIRSGEIKPARTLPQPHEVPAELREICRAWGYS
jgi:hypothetical protein